MGGTGYQPVPSGQTQRRHGEDTPALPPMLSDIPRYRQAACQVGHRMMMPSALTTSLPAPAKLPWESPLCQPLDAAEGTMAKPIVNPTEASASAGPHS